MTNKRVDAIVNTVNIAGTLNIITGYFIFTKSTFLAATADLEVQMLVCVCLSHLLQQY